MKTALIIILALLGLNGAARAQYCFSHAQCADTKPCTTDTCNMLTHQCKHVSTCDDGNECTTNTCTTSGCTYPSKTNFTGCDDDGDHCTADYCMSGTCRPGGPPTSPPPEVCSNSVDEDCDGLTDERSASGTISCRGPLGVYEIGFQRKRGPAPFNYDFEDRPQRQILQVCDFTSDCASGLCFPQANGERPVCIGTSHCIGLPSTWGTALLEGFYADAEQPLQCYGDADEVGSHTKMFPACVPPPQSYSDPRAGPANNTLGQACAFDTDCDEATLWCLRWGPRPVNA